METKILFNSNAQEALLGGVKELHDAVAATLGPRGHTVAIDRGFSVPHITKDGVTVARAYDTDDPMKRMGATLVKMVAAKTCDEAGDGTTTATILSYALMHKGMEKMDSIKNPHRFRKGMEAACVEATDYIARRSMTIDPDDIEKARQIATISANGDVEIGEIVSSAIENVGNDGVITVEESSKDDETSIEISTGFQWDKGLVNPYFVTDPERIECVLEKPYILIWGQNINYAQEILPYIQTIYTAKRAVLVVAPNASNDVIKFLVTNVQQNNGLKACFVKAPGYGQMQKDLLEDLAVKVGGKVIGEEFGVHAEAADTTLLGECDRAVVNSTKTVLVGGAGSEEAIDVRVESIKHTIQTNKNPYDVEKCRERISRLTGGAAIIYVGAGSEVEMKEKKDRMDDAIAATRAAMSEGYVAGGGTIQYGTSKHLMKVAEESGFDPDFTAGYLTVAEALMEHFRTLCRNSGEEPIRIEVQMENVEAGKSWNMGWNPFTERVEDMIIAGIIDPAKVTRVALQNAVSTAVQFLNMSCAMAAVEGQKSK